MLHAPCSVLHASGSGLHVRWSPLTPTARSILTAFSTPYIRSITYLDTPSGVSFGSFGYCEAAESTTPVCHRSVGYEYGSEIIVWLTRTLILFAFGEPCSVLHDASRIPHLDA
jgi:hypothetical protein